MLKSVININIINKFISAGSWCTKQHKTRISFIRMMIFGFFRSAIFYADIGSKCLYPTVLSLWLFWSSFNMFKFMFIYCYSTHSRVKTNTSSAKLNASNIKHLMTEILDES